MPSDPVERFIEAARAHGRKVKRQGAHWLVSCPGPSHAYGDRDPSLHVSYGRAGDCLLKCYGGDSPESIVEPLGLTMADLFVETPASERVLPAAPVHWLTDDYLYSDETGTALYRVRRFEGIDLSDGRRLKTFRQQAATGGGWSNTLAGVERTLYGLPELRRGITAGRSVWIVEGEKDVETMRGLGKLATTAGAAAAWRPELAAHFAGASGVTVVADRDVPGFEVARRIAADLEAAGVPVRVMVPPAPAKDVTELVEAGGEIAELEPLAADAEPPAVELEPEDEPIVDAFETAVAAEVWRVRVRSEAAKRLARDDTAALPPGIDGATLLATDDDPLEWRIRDLLSIGDNLLLAAERKAGKTTLAMNLMVAALRGGVFLDRPTTAVDGRVAYWDAELGRRRFRQWLRAMDVGDTGARLTYRDFRALPFPAIFDDEVAADVTEALRTDDVGMWIVDPAVHAIAKWPTAASSAESDNVTVTQFTNRLDEIKTAAGIDELIVVHHAGKDGTGRGRGASRWEDWPDVIWSLRRGREGSRFQALGRDVELDWIDLSYSKAHHRVGVALAGWRAGIDEVVAAITAAGGKVVAAGRLEEMLIGEDDVRRRKWHDAVEAGEVVTRGERPVVFTLADDLENLVK